MSRRLSSSLRAASALAVGAAVAACIIQQEPPPMTAPAAHAEGQAPQGQEAGWLPDGDYACSLQNDGYQYRPFRCVVYTAENGGQVLEKVGGSQRFRGRVLPDGDGFRFDGTFYCPWGDCTEDVSGSFEPDGYGWYRGTIQGYSGRTSPIVVTLQHRPGGFTYGGATYGGASYGGFAAPPPPPPQ